MCTALSAKHGCSVLWHNTYSEEQNAGQQGIRGSARAYVVVSSAMAGQPSRAYVVGGDEANGGNNSGDGAKQ